ncbi:hypothetical protein Dsin_000446 [Dipteronia sinensis]|uniref:Uncharacterized protein n=1 Tax=Dipteronia sinensis TaxID=43782 RepID=A0AAE0EJE2_9ROSI|nr:hypothetical protein Dsin_000446 [Dipteronia sinensis]
MSVLWSNKLHSVWQVFFGPRSFTQFGDCSPVQEASLSSMSVHRSKKLQPELTLLIIDGVGDDYKELAAVIRARDNPISFHELHEKLRNFEAFLERGGKQSNISITANVATKTNNNGGWKNNNLNRGKPNNNFMEINMVAITNLVV